MKNVEINFVGESRSGTWFIGDFEMGLWSGRLIWFLLQHFGRQVWKKEEERQ